MVYVSGIQKKNLSLKEIELDINKQKKTKEISKQKTPYIAGKQIFLIIHENLT